MAANKKKRILILCTGNSCRSQISEGFARQAGWESYSAGTKPEIEINPFAVNVMAEIGIDISYHTPQSVNEYLDKNFDLVATVCNHARKICPVFIGKCDNQIHHGFEDPANATGTDREITDVYRRLRDEIKLWIEQLNIQYLNN